MLKYYLISIFIAVLVIFVVFVLHSLLHKKPKKKCGCMGSQKTTAEITETVTPEGKVEGSETFKKKK